MRSIVFEKCEISSDLLSGSIMSVIFQGKQIGVAIVDDRHCTIAIDDDKYKSNIRSYEKVFTGKSIEIR